MEGPAISAHISMQWKIHPPSWRMILRTVRKRAHVFLTCNVGSKLFDG